MWDSQFYYSLNLSRMLIRYILDTWKVQVRPSIISFVNHIVVCFSLLFPQLLDYLRNTKG